MRTVSELMTREVVTLEEDDDISFADTFLRLGRIRHLPVVRGAKLVGLITSRDVLRAVQSRTDRGKGVLAKDVMTTQVATARPETPLPEAAALMLRHKFGCLPVLGRGDVLVGIITEADFVKYLVDLLSKEETEEEREQEQPSPSPV